MKEIKIRRISYSPGYGDMLGEYHEVMLRKDKNGNWACVCSDRETYDRPKVTTTYAVSDDAVSQLEKFISEKKILSLEDRPQSDLFATDYSPWSWIIDYETMSFGKIEQGYCNIGEYERYSGRDYEKLHELRERFAALRGKKISEMTEEN